MIRHTLGRAFFGVAALAMTLGAPARPVHAQWVQENEQFYLPAKHNWAFRQNYAGADRLFNAFDYGHSILYEELYTRPGAPAERLEEKEFDFLTRKLLLKPPRVPLEEGAIEIAYAKMAPEAKMMFHWAHLLHRQIYDVWADESLSLPQKDAAVAEILRYYKSRPDLAFSSLPKSMELMDGQYYSLAFREKYPKFNGLIWAYHWLQVGLYEPLIVADNIQQRKAGVDATVGRFWQLIADAPDNMPYLMPMTAAVAPAFANRYPEAAIIFDNLHMMHDVVSDILASSAVPRNRKREEILRAARLFQDSTSYVISPEEWRQMAVAMGSNNMGGPAVGFLTALPEPTVPRGMSMAGMDHSGMGGMQEMDHSAMGHTMPGHTITGHAGMQHGTMPAETGGSMRTMHEMHMRMMADPTIRQRMMADTATHRMMMQMMESMPTEQREHMMRMMHGAGAGGASPGAHEHAPTAPRMQKDKPDAGRRTTAPRKAAPARKKPAGKPAAEPARKAPADAAKARPNPHAGHHGQHSGHTPPKKP